MSVSKTWLGWTALPIVLAWSGVASAAQDQLAEARPVEDPAAPAPGAPADASAASPAEPEQRKSTSEGAARYDASVHRRKS